MPQRHASAHELRQLPPFAHLSQQELRHVERLGYHVSVHHLEGSLLGTAPATVEMHAFRADTGEQHVVKVPSAEPDAAYRCACGLAASVGIDLEG